METSTQMRRIKCLITGNTGAMFDVDGLPVKPAANSALSLELGFFSSTTAIRNLIYYKIGTIEHDWINSETAANSNPDPDSRPSSSSVFGVFQLLKNGEVVFSKDLTFGISDGALTVDDWAAGYLQHATIDIPAGVLVSGNYTARIQTFMRWFRTTNGSINPTWTSDWAPEASSIDIELGSISVLPSEETNDVAVFQSIRVALDSLKFNKDATNILSGDLLQFHSGNATKIEIGLFRNGAIPSELLVNGARLEFSIKDTGMDWYPDIDSGVLLQKTISEIDASTTLADWEAGTKQHAIVELTSDETSIATGVRWMCVDLVSGNSRVTFYSGRIYVVDNGVRGKNLTDILAEARGAAQEAIDARDATAAMREEQQNQSALLKGYNLSDVPNKSAARENLEVYSKPQVDSEISKLSDITSRKGAIHVKRGKFTTAAGSFPQSAWENVTLALDVEISDLEVKVADIACLAFFTCGTGGAGRLSFSWNFPKNSKGNWFRVSGHAPNYTKVFGRNFYLPDELVLGRHTIMVCFGEHVPLETGGYMACKVFWDGIPMQFTDDSAKTFDASGGFLNSGYFYFGGSINVNPQINLNQEKDCPIDIKIHRYKIFNYDISAENAPYSLADFSAGKLVPPALRKNDSMQKILWEMADYTYPENSSTRLILDESGNGGNATITGDIASDKDGASDVFISKLKEQISQLG